MSIASLESFWNPLTCFAICAMVYVVGEFFSHLTKGNISSLMFASFLFLIGFWLDVFPADITTKPGIAAAMSNFGVALLITNLGTMINLETICKEWKTALIALLGLGGILIAAFTFGTWLFGREYALMAAPPISGGTIAGILVQTAANDAGRPELAAFAILVLAFQKFFGMPVATTGMKKEIERLRKSGQLLNPPKPAKELKLPSMRFIPDTPKALNTSNMYLFKLAIVGMLANFVGLATRIPGDGPANYILNPNIAYLLFGLIFTRIGFLEKQSLQKSHSYGLCMIGLMLMLPGSLANVTPHGPAGDDSSSGWYAGNLHCVHLHHCFHCRQTGGILSLDLLRHCLYLYDRLPRHRNPQQRGCCRDGRNRGRESGGSQLRAS